jgi:flagellar basal-body rod modification protein FlgD
MITNAINGSSGAGPSENVKTGFASLDQSDFIKLLTVQMQQQDPFDPVDNKEMLAQMAQFSSLSGINDVNANLKEIVARLDALEQQRADAANPSA